MIGESIKCAVSGNTIFKGNGGSPVGITMLASSGSTPITGNLVDNGGGAAVLDLSGSNSPMNNIGA
jgi:hypothetical protein